MSGLSLSPAELLKVGPVSSRHSLRLLPLSKKKKKQKFVVGDEYGTLSSFQVKKGEPQSVYKPMTLGGPIACVHMGSGKGGEDRAFVATGQTVQGFSKKGKEFFRFQSNLAEPITKLHTLDARLWTATDFMLNQYENGADRHSFVSPDRIHDMQLVPVNHEQDLFAVLACQDRYLRVVKDSDAVAKKSVGAPVTALARVPQSKAGASGGEGCAPQIAFGTANGGLGLATFNGEKLRIKWKTPPVQCESGYGSDASPINSIACFDINHDDQPELLVARDDGSVQVFAFDAKGDVTKLYEHVGTDSVRCVQGGVVCTPGFDEVVACTFSGRVVSFTTEPLDLPDADDSYGRSRGTVQRETRIIKLRKEIAQLEDKVARERERSMQRDKEYLPITDDLVVNSKFQLNPAFGAYDVSIEVPVNIHSVVLHAAVPIDLLESESNLAIVSKTPVDASNGNSSSNNSSGTHFLATYRCLEATNRLEFRVRTIEGQFGDLEATVLTSTQPKAAQSIRFLVKPLSLHHRVNDVDEDALHKPMNSLRVSGGFSLVQIHDWVSTCLPDVPGRLQEDQVTMYFQNTFLGSLLVCKYQKGEASFASPSASVIAILKEVVTKEATAKKVTLNLSLDIKKESVPVMFAHLRPLLDAKHALASQVKLIDGIKELQLHEEDHSVWMAPEYQHILAHSEDILAEFKTSPRALNYLAGVLTDLYVDLCKFRGTNAKHNLPRLYQLIEHYHFDSLLDFFMRE